MFRGLKYPEHGTTMVKFSKTFPNPSSAVLRGAASWTCWIGATWNCWRSCRRLVASSSPVGAVDGHRCQCVAAALWPMQKFVIAALWSLCTLLRCVTTSLENSREMSRDSLETSHFPPKSLEHKFWYLFGGTQRCSQMWRWASCLCARATNLPIAVKMWSDLEDSTCERSWRLHRSGGMSWTNAGFAKTKESSSYAGTSLNDNMPAETSCTPLLIGSHRYS